MSGKFWVFLENGLTHYTFCSAVLNLKYQFYYRVQTKYGSNLLLEEEKQRYVPNLFTCWESIVCIMNVSCLCPAVDFIKMPAGTKCKTFQNCVI